jgi:orotate phosphoribosyltransferase
MDDILIINSQRDERVFIRASSGHFITANKHIDCYVGTSDIKHNHDVSICAARLLAEYYHMRGIRIDTVLCLYETQTLGAYVAHELSKPNMFNPNPSANIFVLGPEYDVSGNMIFRDNLIRMIKDKRVLILMSCITSGKTVERAMDSVAYYAARLWEFARHSALLPKFAELRLTAFSAIRICRAIRFMISTAARSASRACLLTHLQTATAIQD